MEAPGVKRRRVLALFSVPEGCPELWSEIQSRERGLYRRDWCNLAFDTAHFGQLRLLKWLIQSRKVPTLIQNRKGCNLLHAAASFGQESVAEWLLDQKKNYRASVVLFCTQSKRRRMPLEISVRSNHYKMVDSLLKIEEAIYCSSPETLQILNVIRQCCRIAEPDMKEYLTGRLRTMEIKVFFRDLSMLPENQSINDEILSKLTEFPWWEKHRDIEWNENEKFEFYIALNAAARVWNKDLIKWLLDEWNVSLKPPSIYRWKGVSCADVVAMGKHVDEGILESLGDSAEGSQDDYKHDSKNFFDRMVYSRWSDGQCSSLIATMEQVIHDLAEAFPCKNKWFEALCERDFERRLEVLEVFAEKYEEAGAESLALPRLDLVVACGQLHILKWLIDKGFVNLNLPLSSSESMDVEKEQEEDDRDGVAECAICYHKRVPVELQCGHSYCISCIQQIHARSHEQIEGFKCPYCRRCLTIPPSMTIFSLLLYNLESKSSWLRYQPSNTLGEVLMALAAGSGSVFILEYLIRQHHMDPFTALYAGGRNIMHLAASRPNIVSCKWLCLNGYVNLATRFSDEKLTPVQEAMNSANYAASLAFDLFLDLKVVPDNWMDLAFLSPNPGIVDTAEWTVSQTCAAAIFNLLSHKAPLDQLIGVMEKSSFGKCEIFDKDVVNSLLESIIRCGRADVLIWLYNSSHNCQWRYFEDQRHGEFIRAKISQSDVNRSAMEAFMGDLEAAKKLGRDIRKCNSGFGQMIVNGAPVVEVERLIERQEELIKKAQALNLKTCYHRIDFNDIIGQGLNPLEMAAHRGHLHLIEWMLIKPHSDIPGALCQIFSQAIHDGTMVVFKFIVSWLDGNNQMLPTSVQVLSELEPLLHAVVSLFAIRCSCMSHDADGKGWKACIEMAQILIDRPDVDVNALNREHQTALFHLARIDHYGREPSNSAEIADYTFNLIQMLIDAGTDLHHIDANNKTFSDKVLEGGSPLLMRAIRWLALEKGIDIQFVQFSCFDFKVRERVEAEFNAIREEQGRLLLQNS